MRRILSVAAVAFAAVGCSSSNESPAAWSPADGSVGESPDVRGAGDAAPLPPRSDAEPVAPDSDAEPSTPDNAPDAAPIDSPDATQGLAIGAKARVTADLNLRDGAGTSHTVLTVMPCGSAITIRGGPTSGWWNVEYGTQLGWASGAYIVADSAFDPAKCGGASDAGASDAGPTSAAVSDIFDRAKLAVGYSYYWGHGSWRSDGQTHGSCSGSCPSCTHTGQYGADCSGFVAKAWQIPSPTPLTQDLHPYSTYDFVNATTHWSRVDRSQIKPGDALTYNDGTHGHIVLFESGSDPWGNIWTYEARGCATGIVHNLRTCSSQYVTIRRE